ncbi:unnamed protein product [Durusdinium trenchii]|uniref:RING-type E3 ubiquitin transferase n=2 Tax=Durusdinium trenchii TaxID=1381693 RepID=A0ABP0JB13_9DINO
MPCPACGEDPSGTEWKWDPLRWELDPPCTEAEWRYLADSTGAPEVMTTQQCAYMKKVCRGCYNSRLLIMAKVQTRIRAKGGLEELDPSMKMRKEYEAAHANDLLKNRAAKIHGLQSADHFNGQVCRLIVKDSESGRWTVEFVNGEKKAIRESNLHASQDVDMEWEAARVEYAASNSTSAQTDGKPVGRPLGTHTSWEKGFHPGAVVFLQNLKTKELNGRKGRCISFNKEAGRYEVDLGDERKLLKIENLVPAPRDVKPPTRQTAQEERERAAAEHVRWEALNARERHAEEYGWDG